MNANKIKGCNIDTKSLFFFDGLYNYSKTKQESDLTGSMVVQFAIDTDDFLCDCSVDIYKLRKNYKSVKFNDFKRIVQKETAIIEDVYYSQFSNTVLIVCWGKGGLYHFFINDVKDITYDCKTIIS